MEELQENVEENKRMNVDQLKVSLSFGDMTLYVR